MTCRQKTVSLSIVIVLCLVSSLAYGKAPDGNRSFRFSSAGACPWGT
jgi:hypothetical protein